MSKIKLTLPDGEIVTYGKLVSFKAPCGCQAVTSVVIDNVEYALVDSLGNAFTSTDAFAKDMLVTVSIDTANKKALLQNPSQIAWATNVAGEAGTVSSDRHVWFSDNSAESKRAYSDKLKYNPSTDVLTVGAITGNAKSLSQTMLPANTDVNSIITAGRYLLAYKNGYKNIPEDFISGWMDVKAQGTDYVIQTISGARSTEYSRFYEAGTQSWTAWQRCASVEELTREADPLTVERANKDGDGNKISDTYRKINDAIVNLTVQGTVFGLRSNEEYTGIDLIIGNHADRFDELVGVSGQISVLDSVNSGNPLTMLMAFRTLACIQETSTAKLFIGLAVPTTYDDYPFTLNVQIIINSVSNAIRIIPLTSLQNKITQIVLRQLTLHY